MLLPLCGESLQNFDEVMIAYGTTCIHRLQHQRRDQFFILLFYTGYFIPQINKYLLSLPTVPANKKSFIISEF